MEGRGGEGRRVKHTPFQIKHLRPHHWTTHTPSPLPPMIAPHTPYLSVCHVQCLSQLGKVVIDGVLLQTTAISSQPLVQRNGVALGGGGAHITSTMHTPTPHGHTHTPTAGGIQRQHTSDNTAPSHSTQCLQSHTPWCSQCLAYLWVLPAGDAWRNLPLLLLFGCHFACG